MTIEEGPGVGGTIGPSVQPGDTVQIAAPGESFDGAVGVVLDVVAVLPDGAELPYLVARTDVVRV